MDAIALSVCSLVDPVISYMFASEPYRRSRMKFFYTLEVNENSIFRPGSALTKKAAVSRNQAMNVVFILPSNLCFYSSN
jgi:hypothetical protein